MLHFSNKEWALPLICEYALDMYKGVNNMRHCIATYTILYLYALNGIEQSSQTKKFASDLCIFTMAILHYTIWTLRKGIYLQLYLYIYCSINSVVHNVFCSSNKNRLYQYQADNNLCYFWIVLVHPYIHVLYTYYEISNTFWK